MSKVIIEIEASEAYDRLSILTIKFKNAPNGAIGLCIAHQIKSLEDELKMSLGEGLSIEIFNSKEYKNLLEVNEKLFKLIDDIKVNPTDATVLDKQNYLRSVAKRELQKRFFGETHSEIKLGYE